MLPSRPWNRRRRRRRRRGLRPAVAALEIEGEEALAVCRPQLVLVHADHSSMCTVDDDGDDHGYILTYFFEQTNYRWQRRL